MAVYILIDLQQYFPQKASFSGEIPAKMSAIALASAGMAFSIHSLPFGVSVMR